VEVNLRRRFATPAQSSNTIVARTESYTRTTRKWALCLVQEPIRNFHVAERV
jgi:hypothetical protein